MGLAGGVKLNCQLSFGSEEIELSFGSGTDSAPVEAGEVASPW